MHADGRFVASMDCCFICWERNWWREVVDRQMVEAARGTRVDPEGSNAYHLTWNGERQRKRWWRYSLHRARRPALTVLHFEWKVSDDVCTPFQPKEDAQRPGNGHTHNRCEFIHFIVFSSKY